MRFYRLCLFLCASLKLNWRTIIQVIKWRHFIGRGMRSLFSSTERKTTEYFHIRMNYHLHISELLDWKRTTANDRMQQLDRMVDDDIVIAAILWPFDKKKEKKKQLFEILSFARIDSVVAPARRAPTIFCSNTIWRVRRRRWRRRRTKPRQSILRFAHFSFGMSFLFFDVNDDFRFRSYYLAASTPATE